MITAHLPSGYLLYRATGRSERLILGACLLGAVFPDFDLIWFYLIDDRAIHHHRNWVHAPGFWAIAALASTPLLWQLSPPLKQAGLWFFAAWFVHVCLDSIVGSVMWLWPFSDRFFQLAVVQPTHSHFVLSFMAHWSFLLEVGVWLAALALLLQRRAQ